MNTEMNTRNARLKFFGKIFKQMRDGETVKGYRLSPNHVILRYGIPVRTVDFVIWDEMQNTIVAFIQQKGEFYEMMVVTPTYAQN